MVLNKKIKGMIVENKNKCINCKLCFHDCPMMKDFASSPKELMENMILGSIDIKEVAYSCMLCGLCTSKCPKCIDLNDIFYKIRSDLFFNNKKDINKNGYKVVRFHQINSFSPVFAKNNNLSNSKAIFFPGCSLSSYSEEIVLKTYEYLKKHYKSIGLNLRCCGKPTLSMGDDDKFEKYYSTLESYIKKEEIKEIVVACPNCYKTLKKFSKNIKVKTIYEVINEFGVYSHLKNNYSGIDVAIHDSCSTRDNDKIHESVRNILNELGLNIIEFKQNKKNTVCCGAGGMVGVTNPKLYLKQINNRANSTNCENIVCYCESCCESLLKSNKNVLHILDLLFNDSVINKKTFTQLNKNTLSKWVTRYKTTTLCK